MKRKKLIPFLLIFCLCVNGCSFSLRLERTTPEIPSRSSADTSAGQHKKGSGSFRASSSEQDSFSEQDSVSDLPLSGLKQGQNTTTDHPLAGLAQALTQAAETNQPEENEKTSSVHMPILG